MPADWLKGRMDTMFSNGNVDVDREVKLLLDEVAGTMIVTYEWSGQQTYRGQMVAPGHWRLDGENGGKATLHALPNEPLDTLAGTWVQSGDGGIWRIELD